ncbi:MAG: acyl-CoA mutase large subunit family protein [Chloroflexi bacterium]|nr:acyl-CoA mutase large subunit family protein [Chloroflexota bacterium]
MSDEIAHSNGNRLLSEFPHLTYEVWRQAAEQALKGAPFDKKLITPTYEGIDLQPIYRQEDVAGLPHLNSWPGFSPYVRHSRASGSVGEPWLICQELPYSTAEEFNNALRHDLARGQTAIHLLLDKATLLGQDPDEAWVGDVGQGGLSIATLDDLAKALAEVDLERIPIYVNASSAAQPTTALLMALVRRQGKSTAKLRGGIEMDPLGSLAREGTFPRSIAGAYDRMAELMAWAKTHAPQLTTVTVHGQPYHDGGGHAVQELAFVLATAVEYVREMLARNLAIDDIAWHIRFSFSVGANYFMEVAKLRAARWLWAKVVSAFGGSAAAQKMTLHVRTSAWNKTVYDPYVNMLRATTEAFAGVVGGCDSLHVSCFDEAIGLPNEFSRRLARNTHLILQQESHLTRVIDPAGGSWYVEKLTAQVAEQAWRLFQEVERQGGLGQALEAGFPQAQIAQTAAQRAANLAQRRDILVGTNMYPNLGEKPVEARTPDYEALHKKRAAYVGEYRTVLDNKRSTLVLEKLSHMLNSPPDQVMEAAIEAALAGATLGEIARTLRTGDEGPIPQHRARADFSTSFLQVGGFEVIGNEGFATVDAAAQAALASGALLVVICSSDETYPELFAPLTQQIKAAKPETLVLLAGYPAGQVGAYQAAGVDEFIHLRANVYETLAGLQRKLGVV